MPVAVALVRNTFQPPCAGGALEARRWISVDQSIACTSTVKPMRRSACAATSTARCTVLSVWIHQDDARAERARRLQHALGLVGIDARAAARCRPSTRWAAPQPIDRRAHLIALGVARHGDQEFLLLDAPQHRLAHRLVVERRMQVIERHEQLIAELVVGHDHDVRIVLHHRQQIGRRRLVQVELAARRAPPWRPP